MRSSFACLTIGLLATLTGCSWRDDRPFEVCPSDWTEPQLEAIVGGFQVWEDKGVHAFVLILVCTGSGRRIRPVRDTLPTGVGADYDVATHDVRVDPNATDDMLLLRSIIAHEIAHSLTPGHNPVHGNLMSSHLPREGYPLGPTDSDIEWLWSD